MLEEIDVVKTSLDVDEQLKMVLASISEGNTEGKLWRFGGTYFLWDKGNIVFYVFGEKPSSECLDTLPNFFDEKIRKNAKGISFFKFRDHVGLSEDTLKSVFRGIELMVMEIYFYTYKKDFIGCFENNIEGLRVVEIDKKLLKNTELKNIDNVLSELKWMWSSLDKYYENGFGKAAIVCDEIVCWCTAEYVSKDMCGIGIETVREYRQKGIGTTTTADFIKHCLKEGKTPYWGCNASNLASVKLAEKLGFDKVFEDEAMLGRF